MMKGNGPSMATPHTGDMAPMLRSNDQLMREWEVAKHVQRARVSPHEKSADETAIAALPTVTSSPALTLTA
ncbi:MAG TPA: hypothetical protein VJO33_07465 [Gemmatimonadaceae bacterium]|nr:hypothetical protein [Gemmatimonadaceae bacterium]